MENLLSYKEEEFQAQFPHRPFLIQHRLAGHDLFQLPRLVELSKSLPADLVEYNAGNVPVNLDPSKTPRTGLTIEETIRRIEECKSWMALKHVERDPAYRALLDDCLNQVRPITERLVPGMTQREAFIFISSPGSVTPYHMDPEHNFLLQIRGLKTMHVFDGQDPEILPEQQVERYYSGGHRNLTCSEEIMKRGKPFELTPGVGLHVPVNDPHWVQNGPEVSISFSITFRSNYSERRSRIYYINSKMRAFGIEPIPFGKVPVLDACKYAVYKTLRGVKHVLRPAKPEESKY